MSGQWVFIQAADVWLFRNNKPFTAQQNFVAEGQFPPTPMTMQGVIRSYFLEKKGVDWEKYRRGEVNADIESIVGVPANNGKRTMGSLRITGPFVARQKEDGSIERLFKAPLDLMKVGHQLLKPDQDPKFKTDMPFKGWKPLKAESGGKEVSGWLTESQFEAYLQGNVNGIEKLLREDEIYETENRMGLALDYSRRSHKEAMLYRAAFTRPRENVGLLVHVNHEIFDTKGVLNIGGESRSGHYRVVTPAESLTKLPEAGQRRIRIVLLTPAYFSEGAYPSQLSVGGTLVSAAIDKPQPISGWDIANNRPKPLRNHVPAGSVYFYEIASELKELPFKSFTETPDDWPDYGAMGFGTFAIGTW